MFRRIAVIVAIALVLGAALPTARATDYDTDPTFAPTTTYPGWRRLYFGSQDEKAIAFARTGDGGYVVCLSVPGGQAGAQIGLVRLDRTGQPVTAFGGGGSGYRLKDAWLRSVADMTIDAQGRIVVVGATQGPGLADDFGVVRFNADGSDDTSFAGDGGTSAGMDDGAISYADTPVSVLTDPDGRIVVAGTATAAGFAFSYFEVLRFDSDGSRDATFGNIGDGNGGAKGTLSRFIGNENASAAKIVRVAGGHYLVVGTTVYAATDTDFAARILTPSGPPYADGFGSIRLAIDEPGDGGSLVDAATTAVADRPDRVVIAGDASGRFAAVRILVGAGYALSIDSQFIGSSLPGRPARFVGYFRNAAAHGVGVRSDGRILIVGRHVEADGTRRGVLQRLLADGREDPDFAAALGSAQGAVTQPAPLSDGISASYDTAFTNVLFDAGRAVLLGSAADNATTDLDFDGFITRQQSDLVFANRFE